jgi:hypothetical protein
MRCCGIFFFGVALLIFDNAAAAEFTCAESPELGSVTPHTSMGGLSSSGPAMVTAQLRHKSD